MAVIDEQGDAAGVRQAGAEAGGDLLGRLADLDHGVERGGDAERGGEALDEGAGGAGDAGGDVTFHPAGGAADELADRQGVEELVGEQDERAVGQVGEVVMPGGAGQGMERNDLQRLGLLGAQAGGELDQMELGGGGKGGGDAAGQPPGVGHQGAAAGAELGEDDGVGAAELLPRDDRPGAEQLAEDLADLGRGGEVGERVVGGVVKRVGAGHEGVEALGFAENGHRQAATGGRRQA